MNDILVKILSIIVSIASIWITYYLVPYLKSKIQLQQNEQVREFVSMAVKAAEQQIKGSGAGKQKKQEVIEFVTKWLNDKNIKITEEQLSQIIESAVYSMNNKE